MNLATKMAIIGIIITIGIGLPAYFLSNNYINQSGDDGIGVIGDKNQIQKDVSNSPMIAGGNTTINYFQNTNVQQSTQTLEKSEKNLQLEKENVASSDNPDKVSESTLEPTANKNVLIPYQYSGTKSTHDTTKHNDQSSWPTDIKIDDYDSIYVADTSYNGIKKFNKNGNWDDISWGNAEGSIYGKKAGSGWGELSSPSGVAVDVNGNVYVADTNNNRVHKFTSDGLPVDVWGKQGSEEGEFESPLGIAIDSNNKIFVADTKNNRVQIFDQSGKYVDEIGEYGSNSVYLNEPSKIIFNDKNGSIYVIESNNNRIQEFDSNLKHIFTHEHSLKKPVGMVFDSDGFIYVLENPARGQGIIKKFSPTWEELYFLNDSDVKQRDGFGDPVSMAINSNDKIFVLDSTYRQIHIFNPPA